MATLQNITIPNGGNLGSASDPNAITISSGGTVTATAGLDVSGATLTTSTSQKQAMVNASAANQSGVKTALNAGGSAPIYACRAWVNTNQGSRRGNGNVGSVSDYGTGNYGANFSTAMQDTNYCAVGSCRRTGTASEGFVFITYSYSTSQFRWLHRYDGQSSYDADYSNIEIYR